MDIKKQARTMGLLMGLTMSLTLTLVGLLSSGQFTFKGFIINFLISFTISQLLGLIIPIRKLATSAIQKAKLKLGTIKARLLDALVSDLCYTPIMTFIMVFIAYKQATSHGARIPFGPMILRSECISLIIAFIVIFFISPVLMKLVFKDKQ